jgi:hypothetical protein
VNKCYVLKRGSEFKTIFMDQATADLWVKAGWEIGVHPYESQYEALLAMERWKADKRTPP